MAEVIHPVDQLVGSNLRRLRVRKGVSQSAIGDALGITFQQIQKYEKGTNRISASKLHDMAQVLDVDILAFFAQHAVVDAEDGAFTLPAAEFNGTKVDLQILERLTRIRDPAIKRSVLHLLDAVVGEQAADAGS